jgi:hypothetical protein
MYLLVRMREERVTGHMRCAGQAENARPGMVGIDSGDASTQQMPVVWHPVAECIRLTCPLVTCGKQRTLVTQCSSFCLLPISKVYSLCSNRLSSLGKVPYPYNVKLNKILKVTS